MTIKNNILLAFAAAAVALASCSSDDLTGSTGLDVATTAGKLKICVEQDGISTRSVTDNNSYATSFEQGDAIGLFAVVNGTVIDSLNNVRLTYDTSGEWVGMDINIEAANQGAKFYAYYPYKEGQTINTSSAAMMDDIFNGWTVSDDQESKAAFEASNLMTTSNEGSTATKNEMGWRVSLTMTHRMAMLEWELPVIRYEFTNGVPNYVIPISETTLSIGGGVAKPYYIKETGKFRYMLKPGETRAISGSYQLEGKSYAYSLDYLATANSITRRTVGHGAKVTKMALEIGDLILTDGNIVKAADYTSGAIAGVVCNVGTSSALEDDGYNHAIVLGVTGRTKSFTVKASKGASTDWTKVEPWSLYVPANETVNDVKVPDYTKFKMTGYEGTKALESLTPGDCGLGESSLFVSTIVSNYATANSKPSATSRWYLPSLKEWIIVKDNETVIDEALTKAGGDKLWGDDFAWAKLTSGQGYWSSNPRSTYLVWAFTGLEAKDSDNRQKNYCAVTKGSHYVRCMFAF